MVAMIDNKEGMGCRSFLYFISILDVFGEGIEAVAVFAIFRLLLDWHVDVFVFVLFLLIIFLVLFNLLFIAFLRLMLPLGLLPFVYYSFSSWVILSLSKQLMYLFIAFLYCLFTFTQPRQLLTIFSNR